VLLLAVAVPSQARAQQNESSLAQFSWGMAAAICTLVYTPVKVAYAATAIPIGGLVWVWSVGDGQMTQRVIKRATNGDFVVTPQHLKRERPLVFVAYGQTGEEGTGESDETSESR
jgi:hypothetical protein